MTIHDDTHLKEPRTAADTESRRRRNSGIRNSVAVLLMTAIAIGAFVSQTAPAGAISGGQNTAKCLRNAVSADFFFYDQMYPGYTIMSTPILTKYDFNRRGWYGSRTGWKQQVGGNWDQPVTEYFNYLSPGYYRLYYFEEWYSGGVLRSTRLIQANRHLVVYGGSPGYTSNTYKYSDWTSYSYCYEGD